MRYVVLRWHGLQKWMVGVKKEQTKSRIGLIFKRETKKKKKEKNKEFTVYSVSKTESLDEDQVAGKS